MSQGFGGDSSHTRETSEGPPETFGRCRGGATAPAGQLLHGGNSSSPSDENRTFRVKGKKEEAGRACRDVPFHEGGTIESFQKGGSAAASGITPPSREGGRVARRKPYRYHFKGRKNSPSLDCL